MERETRTGRARRMRCRAALRSGAGARQGLAPRHHRGQERRRHPVHGEQARLRRRSSASSSNSFAQERRHRAQGALAGELDSLRRAGRAARSWRPRAAPTSRSSAATGWWCRTASSCATASPRWRISRASRSRSRRPAASPSWSPSPRSRKPAFAFSDVKFAVDGVGHRPLQGAGRRRGRRRHREQRIRCRSPPRAASRSWCRAARRCRISCASACRRPARR